MNYITGTHFDGVIKAIEDLCGIEVDADNRRQSVKKPSLALKLGHALGKLAQLKKGLAIHRNNNNMRQEAEPSPVNMNQTTLIWSLLLH